MEACVVAELIVGVTAIGRVAHRRHFGVELGQRLLVDQRRRRPTGEFLEGGAYRVHLAQFGSRHEPHTDPTVGLALDETHRLELTQCLTNRRLADAQLLGEPVLDDAIAGPIDPVQDALQHQLTNLPTEASS